MCVVTITPAQAADKIPRAGPGESLTVFVDISVMSRKRRAAEKINELHQAYGEQGWTVVDVSIYTENGDLQDFFVTYAGRD